MKNRLLPFQGWRLTLFQAVVVAVFAIFGIRMYELQIVQYERFNADANENRLNALPIAANRGAIRDRNDTRLAFNVPAYNVTIVPAELPIAEEDELAIFNRLSALVDIPPTREIANQRGSTVRSIEELVAEGEGIAPYREVIIAQDIPREVMLQILEERIYMPGVDIQTVGVREYPTGALTAHVVGYMGPIPEDEAEQLREEGYNPAFDRIGYEGVERYLEDTLAGTRGTILREVDVAGEEIRVISETPPVPGESVRLTIDTELQRIAEDALIRWIDFRNENPGGWKGLSSQGVVIAMNPKTGEILAMVSYPSYDNSRFARAIDGEYYLDIIADPNRPLLNNAIKGLFAPGSVWKLITAAGVLEEDVIDPATELIDEGSLLLENIYAPNEPSASQRFVCWLPEGHGNVNLIESIAWSCDVYFYQVGGGNPDLSPQVLRSGGLGINDLFRYATATGIGSELGVELPFETAGRMPDPDWKRRNYGQAWSTGDTYNAAFGQGYVQVTPLQLITQVAGLINGGTLYQPTIIRDFLDEEGNIVTPFEPKVLRTMNLENVPENEPITLLLLEDMLINGSTSLACVCEQQSETYDPLRCDPEGYRGEVSVSGDRFIYEPREYKVHIPYNYSLQDGNVCQPVRFRTVNNPYIPPFFSDETLEYVREGTRQAVIAEGGTAAPAAIDGIEVAGKTGTAEYCDNVARPLGYCVQGAWPAHAWYAGYAPYDDPEILMVSFVYNGGEGSRIALPIVRETMEGYFELKEQRGENVPTLPPVDPTGNETLTTPMDDTQ